MSRNLSLAAVACAAVMMTGCTTMQAINKKTLSDYHRASTLSTQKLQHFHGTVAPTAKVSDVSGMPYVNTTPIQHESILPASFDRSASLSAPAEPVWKLMLSLQSLSGLHVTAASDLTVSASGTSAPTAPPGLDSTLAPPTALGGGHGGSGNATSVGYIAAMSYSGTLKGLLDQIAGNLDATWKFNPRTRAIHFFRYEARTFHISAVPGDAVADSSVGTGGGSGIRGGQGQTERIQSSKSKTQFGGKLSVWKTLITNIKPFLSASGSINVSQPTATLTVRDRWDHVGEIAQYIKRYNASLGTQVEVNVTVYRVQSDNKDSRGINWSLLYNALGQSASQIGATIATARPNVSGLSSLILNSPTQRQNGTVMPFAGSQFFLDALSTLGKTSVVTNSSVDTVNNTPAPVKVVQTTAYVAKTTSLLTSGVSGGNTGAVGAGATLTPGQVETGFTMQVLPSVQPDGHRMLLQVMLSLSSLDALKEFSSGGETIQLPQVSSREFMQRVWMRSGQSLVLAGFQDNQADHTTSSPLDKHLWALGGNRSVERKRDALVIVIRPVATAPQITL